ncbi:protein of unknown function [Cyanobium sp. NIES-981]|nr:protein of unknown function [Cyanobium sp. NIES-981]
MSAGVVLQMIAYNLTRLATRSDQPWQRHEQVKTPDQAV